MLDNVVELIKGYAQKAIAGNSEVPDDKKELAVETTTSALADGMKQQFNSGNISNITQLLSGNNSSSTGNPLISSLQQTVTNALMTKAGLNSGIASGIGNSVVSLVMNAFTKKVNDPQDKDFNVGNLISTFTGGVGSGNGNILGSLGKFL